MQVVRCKNKHYYDADTYQDGCPHCAMGVEPFEDDEIDINSIYTEKYVGGKKGQKLKKKQDKLMRKEQKKIEKNDKLRAKRAAKLNKKNKKAKEDITAEITATDATVALDNSNDETVMISGSGDETVMLSNGEETVMLSNSEETVMLDTSSDNSNN